MTKYHKCQYRQCKWYDLIKLFHNSTSKLILFIKWKIASSFDYCGGCLILRDFLRSQNRIIMEGLIEAMPHSVRLPAERRWLFLYMYLSHSLEWSSSSALCKTCLHGVLPLSSVTFPRSIITVCVCVSLKCSEGGHTADCGCVWFTLTNSMRLYYSQGQQKATHTHTLCLSLCLTLFAVLLVPGQPCWALSPQRADPLFLLFPTTSRRVKKVQRYTHL